jgi:hypothetical protein
MSKCLRLALLWLPLAAAAPVTAQSQPPPVVVELFTSQGCSSCPLADAYLGQLARQPGILALGFHIDYWNYIGWTDPYSLPLSAARQRDYGQRLGLRYVYTPQMVIDGVSEGVGSEPAKIAPLIAAARRQLTAGPALSLEKQANLYRIHVGAGPATEPAATATVWLVGIDRERQTHVLRGENSGAMASDYQIVRSFNDIATWRGQPLDLTVPTSRVTGGEAAVLLQRDGSGPILGAAAVTGPSS